MTTIHTHATELLWLTDLHLDMATDEARGHFLDRLAGIRYDAVLITGDISTSPDEYTDFSRAERSAAA